jgi:formate/nitrite transporter FocA (FNT family)
MPEPASKSPNLEQGERSQAQTHAPLKALVIHEIIRAEGESELERPLKAMTWSGLAAGLSMGFSFAAQALLKADLGAGAGVHALASFGYALGFVIVVLGRQQLFTESTLSAVLPALTRRDVQSVLATLRLWAVVLTANIAGTWLFAVALVWSKVLRPEVEPQLRQLAHEAVSQPFWPTLVRAVFAGWLIAVMVWLLPSSRSARVVVITLVAWLVAFARLSHIIAGSTEAAYGVLIGGAGIGEYFSAFFVPTLIGNAVGGVAMVALLNHAPVADEVEEV